LARAVFKPDEITLSNSRIILEPPFPESAAVSGHEEQDDRDAAAEDVFEGPTADDLRLEAEKFREEWEKEKAAMLNSSRVEAELIVDNARKAAEANLKKAEEEAAGIIDEARKDAEEQKREAEAEAKALTDEAARTAGEQRQAAFNEGFAKGREEGYGAGKSELERLVIRSQVMLERIQDKRAEVFDEAEQQIIDLALLTARKVVKIIPETEKKVVVENIKAALSKVRERGKIIIRVNMADLNISTEHKSDFTALVEGGGSMEIHEDGSIEPGGCVIETDFGEIDARISSQLAGLESKILELSPIRHKFT